MPRRPVVTGQEAIRALEQVGFVFDRQRGSHVMMRHPGRRRTVTVPVHAGETLGPTVLHSILRQAGLTMEEFTDLVKPDRKRRRRG
ncbi:MAG: type II toxin-antitoxin system HicA family toxin [Armatimonadetes bacterium]|nr:type II toxin-antitoxin system HicA family toxin [Armatimonadota bacterium]